MINMNGVISTRKMPRENTRRSRVFSGIFLVEMKFRVSTGQLFRICFVK